MPPHFWGMLSWHGRGRRAGLRDAWLPGPGRGRCGPGPGWRPPGRGIGFRRRCRRPVRGGLWRRRVLLRLGPGSLRRCRLPRLARTSPVRRGRVRLRRQSRRSAITSCWLESRSRLSATVSRWVACWFRRSAAWSRWSGRPRVAARGNPVRSRPARCPVTFRSRLRRRSGRALCGRDGTGTAGEPRSRAGLGTAAGTCPGSCAEQVALPVAATSARSGRVSSGGTSASIWCRRPSPMMRS